MVEQALGGVLKQRSETLRRQHEGEAAGTARKALADPNAYDLAALNAPQRQALIRFLKASQEELKRLPANSFRAGIQPFGQIAYFLELQGTDGNAQHIYVSMDAFTDALDKIHVPTAKSGARFQQTVTNMDVYSNVKGIVARTGLTGGNIEFWPNMYGPANSANVPNASSQVWDFGNEPDEQTGGYGSTQVHSILKQRLLRSQPREARYHEVWENDEDQIDFASCHSFKRKCRHPLEKHRSRAAKH